MIKLLGYVFVLFSFIKPYYVTQISLLNKIYNVLQILVAVFVIFKFFKENKLSKLSLILIVMELFLVWTSIYNNCPYFDVIKNAAQTIAFSMLIEMLMKKDRKILFKSLSLILYILIFLDFIFIINNPLGIRVGLYNFWFLGTKNNHITYIIPAIYCLYVNNFIISKKSAFKVLNFIFMLVMSFSILFFLNSSTSIIVLVILLFLILFIKPKTMSSIKMKHINILYLLLFLGIICFQIQNHFSFLIEDVLHKDLTFTGRVTIWNNTIDYIKQRPLIGYGDESTAVRAIKFNYISAVHCHNMILEVAYRGGFILLILFIMFWLEICKRVDEKNKLASISKSILIIYCIELLTEAFEFEVFLWVLVLICYSLIYIGKEEENVKE